MWICIIFKDLTENRIRVRFYDVESPKQKFTDPEIPWMPRQTIAGLGRGKDRKLWRYKISNHGLSS